MDVGVLVVSALVSAGMSFVVARAVMRTGLGVAREQEAVRELELWVDSAAPLAADLGGAWASAGHSALQSDSDQWVVDERQLRIELRRLKRHLPESVHHGLVAAKDIALFNEAAVGGSFRPDLLKPEYASPPPIPDGGQSWAPVGQWIDMRQDIVAGACQSYLSKGRSLFRWARA